MGYGTHVTVKANWALVYIGNCTRKKMKIPNVLKSIYTGGRREQLSMANILQFVTGADEEPVLGFRKPPTTQFPEVIHSFLPTANTMYMHQLPSSTPTKAKHRCQFSGRCRAYCII